VDNPQAVDTICTLCEKGCNTTAWIKAKPEWAKGAQLVRMTPRLNHEINGYWMCDIGRFDYHWVEGNRRLLQPHVRRSAHWTRCRGGRVDRRKSAIDAAGGPEASVSWRRPASLQELFALKLISAPLEGDPWRQRESHSRLPRNSRSSCRRAQRPRRAAIRVRRRRRDDAGCGIQPATPSTRAGSKCAFLIRVRRIGRRDGLDPGGAQGRPDRDVIVRASSRRRSPRLTSCCRAPPGSRRTRHIRT
jgi:hypothetical protein